MFFINSLRCHTLYWSYSSPTSFSSQIYSHSTSTQLCAPTFSNLLSSVSTSIYSWVWGPPWEHGCFLLSGAMPLKKPNSPFPEALSYTINLQLGEVLGAHLLSPGWDFVSLEFVQVGLAAAVTATRSSNMLPCCVWKHYFLVVIHCLLLLKTFWLPLLFCSLYFRLSYTPYRVHTQSDVSKV